MYFVNARARLSMRTDCLKVKFSNFSTFANMIPYKIVQRAQQALNKIHLSVDNLSTLN